MDDGHLAKTGWMEKLVWGRARTASGLGLDRLRALVVVDGQSIEGFAEVIGSQQTEEMLTRPRAI